MNVFIVLALFSFCAGREERAVGDLLALLETLLKLDAVNSSSAFVLCPAATGDIAPDNGLDGQNLGALDEHGASLDLVLDRVELLLEFGREVGVVGGNDVRFDERGSQQAEPEGGKCMEKLALVGDAVLEDNVEGRDPVGSDKEDGACVRTLSETCIVDITNLALCDELEGQVRSDEGVVRHAGVSSTADRWR